MVDEHRDLVGDEIAAARDSAERSRLLFAELTSTLGLAKASQLWWSYFSAYDAAET